MPRSDNRTVIQNLFGDDFNLLSEKLADSDPRERAKALIFLDSYLDDCTRPILELKRAVEFASRKAMRAALESRELDNDRGRTGGSTFRVPTASSKRPSRKEEIAAIEELVAASGDLSATP